ncbi:hypothetical protein B5E60_08500 [Alistipes sp. An116]|nr:hypothetical protein B5G09_07170 [Alistipes sp. An54]OUQ53210.1 hypothetical protein B5E60_08500 [Alistipes sp. An116]
MFCPPLHAVNSRAQRRPCLRANRDAFRTADAARVAAPGRRAPLRRPLRRQSPQTGRRSGGHRRGAYLRTAGAAAGICLAVERGEPATGPPLLWALHTSRYRRGGPPPRRGLRHAPRGNGALWQRLPPLYDPAQFVQPPFRLLADSVGYIYAGTFSREYLAEVGQTLPRTRALIIDLRTYPLNVDGALIALAAQSLCTEPVVAWQTLHQTLALPGLFFRQEQWLDNGFEEGAAQCTEPYKGRVILLVNELTQSNPEFQAMALQRCPQTLTIGSPTSGADGDIVSLPLPGGLMTYFSGIGIFYPDGTPTQNVGVRLDVEVLPTAEGLQARRDEVLEQALELTR